MDDDRKRNLPADDDSDAAPTPPRRPYSLAEAVGRAAGDALKGASPVDRNRQALLAVGEILETRFHDPEGSLRREIMASLAADPPLLAAHGDRPAGALAAYLDRVLGSDLALAELVRAADARWGREYRERPHFERDGLPPHPDDPYTWADVRRDLRLLRDGLED